MSLLQLSWFTLSIISVITWSLSNIIQKASLKGEQVHPAAFSAFFQLLVGIITIPAAISGLKEMPSSVGIWGLVIISSLLYFGANLLFFYGLKDVEVSQTTILTSTRSIWYLLLGLVFFKESITIYKMAGIILIVVGVIMAFYKRGVFASFNKKHSYLIIYALIFSIAGTLDKYILNYFTPGAYQVIAFILPATFTMFFIPGTIKNMKPLLSVNKNNAYLVISSITYTIAALSMYTAYKVGGEISKVGPISQASIILTVILGIIFLKERENLAKKLIGSLIVFAGVLLMKMI